MKEIIEDGQKILMFEDVEEAKWYYHKKMCQNKDSATSFFLMEHLVKCRIKEANQMLKRYGEPCMIKEK